MSDTKWTLGDWIPRGGMICWHSADISADGGTINDASGNGRTLESVSAPPDYQTNVINGLPALYFDGSTNSPPKWTGGSVTPKHAFVVAGCDGANFGASFRGLLGAPSSGEILVGSPSSTLWYNFSSGQAYRRYDVGYAESASPGIFNEVGVMEISNSLGWAFAGGIQIGQQRNLTDRRWKGWWCEHILYDRVLSDVERWKIYRYIACKYNIWQQAAAGSTKAVFPFPADRPYGREHGRETYLSEPYDGDPSALVRGSFKSGYELGFTTRRQEEFDAAKVFYEDHHPLGEFAFRDYRFYPYRDTNVRFNSTVRERGSDVSYRFNYNFDVVEA